MTLLTVDSLVTLLPFTPWAGWGGRTLDELKALVIFRYERAGDAEWSGAYEAIQKDIAERKAAKKAKREARR